MLWPSPPHPRQSSRLRAGASLLVRRKRLATLIHAVKIPAEARRTAAATNAVRHPVVRDDDDGDTPLGLGEHVPAFLLRPAVIKKST